jgi:hypothetical protein
MEECVPIFLIISIFDKQIILNQWFDVFTRICATIVLIFNDRLIVDYDLKYNGLNIHFKILRLKMCKGFKFVRKY